jgi:dihydroflavonol-4-reductase
MISNYLKGKISAYINCTLNFVDVRDVALWHLLAAEKGLPGRRYILSGHNLSLYDFFLYLSRATGNPEPKWRIPYLPALWWGYLEHWIGLVTGRRPQSSVAGIKLCRRSLAFDGSRAWQELGHKPSALEETIKDAVDWHKIGPDRNPSLVFPDNHSLVPCLRSSLKMAT